MMERRTRSSIVGGVLLILFGLFFLAYQLVPERFNWFQFEMSWPMIVITVGVGLLLFGLLVGAPGMAVPACIVSGIGLILYWQNLTGNWESWAYVWTLIPGFVGIGVILAGIFGEGRLRDAISGGLWLILISLVMFAIFGSFLGGMNLFGPYWPALLILLGLILLVRAFFRRAE
ncbi:MAG: hypothetical protein EHM21_10170 [Chloroflexi bacterium]|nr:MAG: hypothetical protein EHM21_10170 [Chloroflexota bacterium]